MVDADRAGRLSWASPASTSSKSASGSPATSLNQRLDRLVEAGVLVKVPYSEHPPRYDYRLTDKGRDLWPVLTAMRQWGDKYAAPDGPPLEVTHKGCGEVTDAVMACSACGEPIGAEGRAGHSRARARSSLSSGPDDDSRVPVQGAAVPTASRRLRQPARVLRRVRCRMPVSSWTRSAATGRGPHRPGRRPPHPLGHRPRRRLLHGNRERREHRGATAVVERGQVAVGLPTRPTSSARSRPVV